MVHAERARLGGEVKVSEGVDNRSTFSAESADNLSEELSGQR